MNTNCKDAHVSTIVAHGGGMIDQPTNLSAKLYKVWVLADVKVTFGGNVSVYATDETAIKKVKAQIDARNWLDDLEMEAMLDEGDARTMLYADVKENLHLLRQTFTVNFPGRFWTRMRRSRLKSKSSRPAFPGTVMRWRSKASWNHY